MASNFSFFSFKRIVLRLATQQRIMGKMAWCQKGLIYILAVLFISLVFSPHQAFHLFCVEQCYFGQFFCEKENR